MDDKIVEFPGVTTLDIDPKKMLENILAECPMDKVVVMRYDEAEDNWVLHSSTSNQETIVYVGELIKLMAISGE